MPKINITHEAHEAMRQYTRTGEFADSAFQRPDGSWDIKLQYDTVERLCEIRQAGESYSDAIIRLMALIKGLN